MSHCLYPTKKGLAISKHDFSAGFSISKSRDSAPHRSPKDMLPANRSSEIVMIVGEDQHCLSVDVTLEQLEEIMIPKAIDYFYRNTKATIYKMIWKTKHSSALIQVEKASMSTQKCFGGA